MKHIITIVTLVTVLIFFTVNIFAVDMFTDYDNFQLKYKIDKFIVTIKDSNLEEISRFTTDQKVLVQMKRIIEKYHFNELEGQVIYLKNMGDDSKKVKVLFLADFLNRGSIFNMGVSFKSTFMFKKIKDEWYIIKMNFERDMLLRRYLALYFFSSLIFSIPFTVHLKFKANKDLFKEIMWFLVMITGNVFGIMFYVKKVMLSKKKKPI